MYDPWHLFSLFAIVAAFRFIFIFTRYNIFRIPYRTGAMHACSSSGNGVSHATLSLGLIDDRLVAFFARAKLWMDGSPITWLIPDISKLEERPAGEINYYY